MRLLWISDSPDTPSGFGTVTRFVCAGLARLGHDVDILGWQTTRLARRHGCTVHPVRRHHFGGDALHAYLVEQQPDVVVVLADIPWVPEIVTPRVRRLLELRGVPLALYFPVDGARADGRLPDDWVDVLRGVDLPVAMSRHGAAVAADCGVPVACVPHGVDLKVFTPPADRERAKERIGAAGRFVVLSDSRNQPRKLLPRLLDVFAAFAADRPDALLHLHTDPDDAHHSPHYSYDLRADVERFGLGDRVRFTAGFQMRRAGGVPLRTLAGLYRAADVHLLSSVGEGFGLPTLQAAAAGAVPLAGAHSASRELVTGHGAAIAVADWVEDEYGIRRGLIDVGDAVRHLARYHGDRAALRADSARSRRFALGHSWDPIVERWSALLSAPTTPRARPHATVVRARRHVTVTLSVARFADRAPHFDPSRRLGIPVGPPPHPVLVAPSARDDFSVLRAVFPSLHTTDDPAEAVLLLDPCSELPESVVLAAARRGVPGVGDSPLHAALWPELAGGGDAVEAARRVLTDAALAACVSAHARRAYAPISH